MVLVNYFPGLSTIQIIASPILLIWIIVETYFDFKDRDIPVMFSIVPVLGGLLFLFFFFDKALSVLMLLLIAASNFKPSARLLMTVPLLAISYFVVAEKSLPVIVGYFVFFTFFQISIMGGADALAATYLLCWYPSWGMLAIIILILLVISIAILIVKHKLSFLAAIINTVSGKEGTRFPAMITFSSSLFVFLVVNLIIQK